MPPTPTGRVPLRVNVSPEAGAIADDLALSRFGGAYGAKGTVADWALVVLGEVMSSPAARAEGDPLAALAAYCRGRK